MKKELLDLQLFADGAGTGAGNGNGADNGGTGEAADNNAGVAAPRNGRKGNPLAGVLYGRQAEELKGDDTPEMESSKEDGKAAETTMTPEERAAEFEKLIKGEYKDEFGKRTQGIINKRIGEMKTLQEQSKVAKPIFEALAEKYGIDSSDITALAKAVSEDTHMVEEAASRRGMEVDQYKKIREAELGYKELQRTVEQQRREQESRAIYDRWTQQAEEFKTKFGKEDFNLEDEIANPDFAKLLRADVPVEAAYMAVHHDEILGSAMATTASKVREQMANNIASRASRPAEGAASAQAGVTIKRDVKSFTKADRAEIARRVANGERIVL